MKLHGNNQLTIKCISDPTEFSHLSEKWNELAEQTAFHSIFLTHEWFFSAWQWRKLDSALRILCFYKEAELVGICPFIRRTLPRPTFNLKVFEFLTVPDTQFCDVLSSPEYSQDVIQQLVHWLHVNKRTWDLVHLRYIPLRSSTPKSLTHQLNSSGLYSHIVDDGTNPYVTLTGSWDDFYSGRSRRLKKGNNLAANKLKRIGETQIEWIHGSSVEIEQIEQYLAQFVDISSHSWKRNTGFSLDNPGPNSFIQTLTQQTHKRGWLSLWFLCLGATPVAAEYQLTYKGKVHALRSDFVDQYSEASPGTYLNWQILKGLFENNFETYYMGPGDNPYKHRWTEHAESICAIYAYSNTLRGRLIYLIDCYLKPILRRQFNRLIKLFRSRGRNP